MDGGNLEQRIRVLWIKPSYLREIGNCLVFLAVAAIGASTICIVRNVVRRARDGSRVVGSGLLEFIQVDVDRATA